MEGVLARELWEEVPELAATGAQDAPVGGDAHQDLGHGEGDDLGVVELATCVAPLRGQEIVGGAVHCCQEQVEVGDWARFARPAKLSAWLGVVPTLSQSGRTLRRGAITKTGSRHARRLLVESARHYARPPRLGATLDRRQEGQPAHILQIAWRAQCRVHRLSQRLRGAGKPANVVTVAVAREPAWFLWAAAVAS